MLLVNNIVVDEALFKSAVDAMGDMVFVADNQGVIAYVNTASNAVLGRRADELVGTSLHDIWPDQTPKSFSNQALQTAIDQKIFRGDVCSKRTNGSEYHAHVTLTPLNAAYVVGIVRDITREKEIDRAKTDFVFLASHQLRTPSAIIRWSVEALQDGQASPEEQTLLLQQITDADDRMISIVDTMLHIARLESGTITGHPERIEPNAFIQQELQSLAQHISQKQLQAHFEPAAQPSVVVADKNFLQIIIQNLLSNAIKYTPQGGSIAVTVTANATTTDIHISDTGYGIPKDQQAHIFTKMFRADNAKTVDNKGSGLGLYLVKLLVDAQHGAISFTSEENKGTTFTLSLPHTPTNTKRPQKTL